MPERDNFTPKTKRILGDRVGYRCSCPTCRRLTIGPTKDISAPLLIAEAAHISGASAGGPRFNEQLTVEERKAVENGIWLCASCHTMVDKDSGHYTSDLLREWRIAAEEQARKEVEGELIFQGYVEPEKMAESHFSTQVENYVSSFSLGRPDDSKIDFNIPTVWIQIASISTLKGLVKIKPERMVPALKGINPVGCQSWGNRVSRFGVAVEGYGESLFQEGYCLKTIVQLLKDGSVIIGFVLIEHNFPMHGDVRKVKQFPWIALEGKIFKSIEQGFSILKGMDLLQPAFIRLLLQNVNGYGPSMDPSNWFQYEPIDTDTLITSPSLVVNFDLATTEIARPLLEEFWQHLGVWKSPSYDSSGAFVRKPSVF